MNATNFEHKKAIPCLTSEKNNILKFQNFKNQFQVPVVYYADFESIIKPLTNGTSKHELCSYSFYGLGQNGFYKNFEIYTGKNANDTINTFISTVKNEAIKLDKELNDRIENFKKPNLMEDENTAEVHFTPIGQTRGRKKSRVVSFDSAHQAKLMGKGT